MVRPDDDEDRSPEGGRAAASRCTVPAGASPVRVSAGALGSRPQARREIDATRAGCRKPGERDRKQSCGPQRAVNAEQASSDSHPKGVRKGRDRHLRSKAMDSARIKEPERALDLPGVVAVARSEGTVRNRRGPPWQLTSSKAASISAEREVSSCQEGVRGGGGQRPRHCRRKWPYKRLFEMGLHQLRTSVRYPAQATPRRPSVSRVRENRTHGLNGGPGQVTGGAPPRKS